MLFPAYIDRGALPLFGHFFFVMEREKIESLALAT